MVETVRIPLGREDLIIQTGKMAKQADGAVVVQYGGTVVLVSVCGTNSPREGINFFPLTVDYQEKSYAAGKIPGGFFKREGRPSEKEILTARMMDRPIRPLFPEGYKNEVQIMSIVLSYDGQYDPDVLAMLGASTSLMISNIPFAGPVAALRVGRIGGSFVINPTQEEIEGCEIDLVMSAGPGGIVMIEAGSKQVSESLVLEALAFGAKEMDGLLNLQKELAQKVGRKKMAFEPVILDKDFYKQVEAAGKGEIEKVIRLTDKEKREEGLEALAKSLTEELITEDSSFTAKDVQAVLDDCENRIVRRLTTEEKKRVDGRGFEDIREISCEIGVLPRTHGSGLFTRGQTQSLAVTTLGTTSDEQRVDALTGEYFKSFMLHYNFPPFSVGEVKPVRGTSRREVGHGVLAERALRAVMPDNEKFPYTVRVVSDILESNGSSSMATVCATSISLMDAGVPIEAAVSGIAMGLIKEGDEYAILTDIAGVEDHYGDMDFKVAGTTEGITAVQMDLKIDGLPLDVLKRALEQARKARLTILDKMKEVISAPKEDLSEFAPRIVVIKINPDRIRDVIGPGGKMIRKIVADTGVDINVEDDGSVQIASSDAEASAKAVEIIKNLTVEVEVGKIYKGTVKRIMPFGAFCEVLPGKEGLCHISELAAGYVEKVEDVVKVGDEVTVKAIEIDGQGRLNLSVKKALPNQPEESSESSGPPQRPRQKPYRPAARK